jgi:hypothetical protein
MVAQFPKTASIVAPGSLESVWVPMVRERAYFRASDTSKYPLQARNSPSLARKAYFSNLWSALR